ncbi:hypothetical protein IFM89_025784 [Coptis chinensis]|uniref:Mitochondrial carrier protein n=1 Tax=Coptis chinensis TaxID=261450 RepID=A0A835HGY6_9MAGN|nr:hypothetical protein IFM89_025784 [Coptis chinensis]
MATTDVSPAPKFQKPDFITMTQTPSRETTVSAHDGLEFWQFMIAGSIAGCVEHMAMFPVDTLKTRMQAITSCPIQSVDLRQVFKSVLKVEGAVGLYRGIGAMGLGAGPAHAVYFSVYEICKEYFSRGNPNNSVAHAGSGVLATVASDAVFTPMDVVKQRLQLRSSPYKGVMDCMKTVLREEGIGSFYASYKTTVLMNAPFTAVHFATYEAVKRGLMEISPESVSDERLVVHATAGAAAGALAAAVTTPLDVVKTQLQCQFLSPSLSLLKQRAVQILSAVHQVIEISFKYDKLFMIGSTSLSLTSYWGVCGCDRFTNSSITDVIKTIVKKDGYTGLLRGWKPRMLFHAPAAAICWSTYEAGKGFFQEVNDSRSGRSSKGS